MAKSTKTESATHKLCNPSSTNRLDGCENYYGKGLFTKEDFTALATQLADIKGKFILSLNDTPGIRNIFNGFDIENVQTQYTCSK